MSAPRRGGLAAQLQPRIVLTVAVMAVLMCLATVLGARGILVNQLDRELDTAQKRQQGPGQSDALGLTKLRQHFEILPGSAANVENLRILDFGFWILDYLFEKCLQNGASADKPPMRALDLVHDGVCMLLHFLR